MKELEIKYVDKIGLSRFCFLKKKSLKSEDASEYGHRKLLRGKRLLVTIQLTNAISFYLVLFCQPKGSSKKKAISWLEKLPVTGKLGEASLSTLDSLSRVEIRYQT